MRLILFFILLSSTLFGQIEYKFRSENAEFDGNDLLLSGKFAIEHKFGKIVAGKAKFLNFDKNRFEWIFLNDNVQLILNSGGVLESERADFDIINQKITFLSQDQVSFTDILTKKNNKQIYLKILSDLVECKINSESITNPSLQDLSSISFLNNAHIIYDEKLHCYGDKAVYHKDQITDPFVSFYPKKNGFCLFVHDKDEIKANFAKFNLREHDLFLEMPKGQLITNVKDNSLLLFSSDELYWHNFEHTLLLKKNVFIDHKAIGYLQSEEVEFIKKIKDNSLHKIISSGKTNINFYNKNENILSQLICNGVIELDNEKKKIIALSKNDPEDLLTFHDEMVTICAKKANIEYTVEEKLKNIVLEDSIRFIYKKDQNTLGYGIADKISYNPYTKILKLSSLSDKKVLFWQDDDAIRLSATEIDINNKESIKGIGDVRFTFDLNEEELFKEIFSQYIRNL